MSTETWTPVQRTPETWTPASPSDTPTPDPDPDPTVPAPVSVIRPVITGVFDIFRTLTCSAGTWTDASVFAFQWLLDGVAITGATSATYPVQRSDRQGALSCTVTATGPGGSASRTTEPITARVRYDALPVVL